MIGRLFGSNDSNDGCTAHHYGEYEPTDLYRADVRGGDRKAHPSANKEVVVQRRYDAECLHDGCKHSDVGWRYERWMPLEEMIEEGEIA